jgi:hypothetical protein
MLIRSPRFPVRISFDPVAVGAEELVLACNTSTRRQLQVLQDAIEMGKPYAMAGSQLRATTAAHMVILQGTSVCASVRAVIVMPMTVGIFATPSELLQNLETQVPLSYSALTLRHVYKI